jgi:mycothione reductase
MLIYPADRVVEIQEARRLGIEADIREIDFNSIMDRMRRSTGGDRARLRQNAVESTDMDFYEGGGHFTGDYAIEVNGESIEGKKIVIASGSRPFVPPIRGLDGIGYLTNETALQLRERPDSMIIIGGGYIAVEFGHFFAAMGTRVTILEMADRLVLSEEAEFSDLLRRELSKRMEIHTGAQAQEVKESDGGVTVLVKDRNTSAEREFIADKVMVAVGRISNADVLKVENTGVVTNERGFIKTNEYLETSKNRIWAIGDANGRQMFRHVANREAELVAENMLRGAKEKMDYNAIPHAVYSYPQIASVGMTEENALKLGEMLVGRARYSEVAKGEAMMEENGFAKAIVEKTSGRILGFHIIGPYAPILIQEVINAISSGGNVDELAKGIHIHPALPELVLATLGNLQEP